MSNYYPCVGALLTEDGSIQLLEPREGIIECKNLGGANECKVPVATLLSLLEHSFQTFWRPTLGKRKEQPYKKKSEAKAGT